MKQIVLQVVNGLSAVGGAETVAATLALRASPDWEPHVLCLREGEGAGASPLDKGSVGPRSAGHLRRALHEGGVPVHYVPLAGLRDIRNGLRAYALIRRLRPAVIHAHNRPSDAWAMLLGRLLEVPARLYTRHLTYTDVTPAMRRRYGRAARAAHAVVAVSAAVAGHLVREEETPETRIVTIPNGIDLGHFDPGMREARGAGEGLRAAWGIPPDVPLVGTLSRLVPQKGLDVFLECARLIRQEEPSAHFAIVGEGEERQRLEALATRLGIAEAVVFPGFQDAPASYAAFDLFMTTALHEGLPLTLLEAMASGLAVVAPNLGAFREVIEDGVTGFLPEPASWATTVERLDPAPFARTALRLLRNVGLRLRVGEAARKRVERAFGLETMVARHEALYAKLLGDGEGEWSR